MDASNICLDMFLLEMWSVKNYKIFTNEKKREDDKIFTNEKKREDDKNSPIFFLIFLIPAFY